MRSAPCAWMCSASSSSCAITSSASTSLAAELELLMLRLLATEADFVQSAAHGVTTEAGLLCTRCRFGGVPSGGLLHWAIALGIDFRRCDWAQVNLQFELAIMKLRGS